MTIQERLRAEAQDGGPYHLCHDAANYIDALEKDATRYRWLRDNNHLDYWATDFDDEEPPKAEIDYAIDVARLDAKD